MCCMLGCLYCTELGWFGTRGKGFSGWNVCERDCQRHPSLEHNAVQSGVLTRSLRRSAYSSTDLSALDVSKASVLTDSDGCVIYTDTTHLLWTWFISFLSFPFVVFLLYSSALLCNLNFNFPVIPVQSANFNGSSFLSSGPRGCFIWVISCHESRK